LLWACPKQDFKTMIHSICLYKSCFQNRKARFINTKIYYLFNIKISRYNKAMSIFVKNLEDLLYLSNKKVTLVKHLQKNYRENIKNKKNKIFLISSKEEIIFT
jgi:hypothetical protein